LLRNICVIAVLKVYSYLKYGSHLFINKWGSDSHKDKHSLHRTMKFKSISLAAAYFFLIMSGCTTQEKKNNTQPLIDYSQIPILSLEQEFTISASDNYIPAFVMDIIVDDDGRILVSERQEKAVHQFDSTGTYVARVARSGRGPGELTRNANAHSNGDVLVMSNNNGNLTEYRPNDEGVYSFVEDHTNQLPGPMRGIRSDGEFTSAYVAVDSVQIPFGVIPPEFTTDLIHIVRFDGDSLEVEENVLSIGRHSSYVEIVNDGQGMTYNTLPYRYSDSLTPLRGQQLMVTRPRESAIQIYDEDLDLVHDLELNVASRPVSDDDFDFHFSEFSGAELADRKALVRDIKPPFTWVIMDDERRFWLRTDHTKEGYEYVILSYDGEPIGRFYLTESKRLFSVKDDKMYLFDFEIAEIEVIAVKI
jgi:hypothetical protein